MIHPPKRKTKLVFPKVSGITFALGLLFLSIIPATDAQIVANFSDGNSTSAVDAWTGRAGNGWASAWSSGANKNASLSAGVVSTMPLQDGGNYLSVAVTNSVTTGESMQSGIIGRRYEAAPGIDLNSAHTISFEFRLDSDASTFDRVYFSGAQKSMLNLTDAGTTWLIRGNSSGTILLHDGTQSTRLDGITLNQGNVYRFTINVMPSPLAADSRYSVTVEDLTAATGPTTSGLLKFYTPQTDVGGFINFTASVTTGNTAIYSLDNIAVIPEASSVTLGGFALTTLAFLHRFRSRSKQL